VLAATTAFGKTILAIRMMAERGRNTLVLVHRRQFTDQWIERLTAFSNMPRDAIGMIGGGRRKPKGQVEVALIQSLVRKGEVDDIVGNYGHLVVDECHHLSAVSFELVARRSKARYVLGLSATASELAIAYAGGLSPIEVTVTTLERVRSVNPQLNAIITLDEAGAVQAAEQSARRWKDGRSLGPLDGVPMTIKDNLLVAGLRATWGSRLYSGYVPDEDELPVRRLREAGAVILGKTNVPELTLYGFTDNAVFGTTGNPWNPELTPGGSSGGAVASVASGMGAVALGTDGGGSIRRPAAHTGLIGFKPSRDAVMRGKGFPAILHDFEVIGPIARCVDDVVRMMEIIAGPVWSRLASEPTSANPRIAYAPTFDGAPVDPFIRNVAD